MLKLSFRRFALIDSLRELKSLSDKNFEKTSKEFISSYKSFVDSNSEDIYCYTSKLTPSQSKRSEMLAEEITKLSPIQFRAFFYLVNESQKRNFIYKPFDKEKKNDGNDLWSEDFWPSIHPQNLEFQKETDEYGLLGFHGFPKDFLEVNSWH